MFILFLTISRGSRFVDASTCFRRKFSAWTAALVLLRRPSVPRRLAGRTISSIWKSKICEGSAWRRKIERWAHAIGHCLRKEVQASRVCHMSVTCKPLPQPLEISGITVKFQCVPVPVSKNLYQMSTVKPLWTKAYELERWDTAGASNLHEMKIHKDTHFLFCRAPRSLPFGKSTSQVAALKPRQQVPCPLVFNPTIHYRMFLAQSTLEKWWGCKRQLTIQAIRDCLTFW